VEFSANDLGPSGGTVSILGDLSSSPVAIGIAAIPSPSVFALPAFDPSDTSTARFVYWSAYVDGGLADEPPLSPFGNVLYLCWSNAPFPLSNCSPSIPAGVLDGAVYISNDARTLSMSGGYLGGTNVNNLPPFDFQITLRDGLTIAPLPAALPLFATGVGALGLLGWRRKRKAQAA